MDAGALDVLHDPGDQRVAAVRDGVDLDLLAPQVFVDEHAAGAGFQRGAEIPLEVLGAVGDLHTATAQYVAWPYQHGVADLRRDRDRLGRRRGGAARGLRDSERVSEVMETAAVLGERDGIGRGAGDLTSDRREVVREIQCGLPAELRQYRGSGAFVFEHRGDRLLVQGIEVEARGRVEVG